VPSPSSDSATAGADVTVALPAGVDLHARPAAQFVRLAMGFGARITVSAGERAVDAKSLLSVLSLGAKGGTSLRLAADGDDARDAVAALAACVTGLTE
jgi:phosphocarrier protein HPr